ncbi:l-fucose permease [Fusarium longipes]|uniref:L-fucose permease n=1 Tax=Fusarium longipes TaxID=694270 RepID=A0A395SR31_9HYPO|nr:l-fucose permease [Fusarium longipes]
MVQTKQPNLWVAEWLPFATATVFIFLRLMSRKITRVGLWWDDYAAIGCYACAVVWAVETPLWIINGLGLHAKDIDRDILKTNSIMMHYLFAIEQTYTFVVYLAKVSLLLFYWRMFRITNIKIAVYSLLGLSTLWLVARLVVGTIQCLPVKAFWELSMRPEANCPVETPKYVFGSIISHILLDFLMMVLPVIQIKRLQLPLIQKFGVLLMFVFGTLICIIGLVVAIAGANIAADSTDLSWDLADTIIWGTIEINLLTVSTSLPTIRPACLYFGSKLGIATTSSITANSFGQSHSRPIPANKSIRLSEMPKDENSSTYELATRMERNGTSISDSESHGGNVEPGNHTVITVPSGKNDLETSPHHSPTPRGILIKNETIVTYKS